MSQFLPEGFGEDQPKTTSTVPTRGPEQYLSPEERSFLQRIMAFPADLPPQFRSWMLDYIAVNGLEIPISQVRGYENAVQKIVDKTIQQFQSTIYTHTVSGALQGTTSSSYTDLATPGPTLSSLPDGSYLLWYGAYIDQDADVQSAMSLSINSASAVDLDAVKGGVDGLSGDQVRMSISRAVAKTLSGGSNTITCKYKRITGSATPQWDNRWIIALRIGA